MELYLRITELFLEAGNILEADRYVKRASLLQQDVKEDSGTLLLKYSVNLKKFSFICLHVLKFFEKIDFLV
jgi:hypothetical protein